jgi:hypothetical protein
LDAWRSGSACDSSNRDIHKVIRSNRVAFIDLTIHEGSLSFALVLALDHCRDVTTLIGGNGDRARERKMECIERELY